MGVSRSIPKIGKYLLDTNIIVALLNGDPRIQGRLERAAEVYLSAVVIGELQFGAQKSGKPVMNTLKVETFAASCVVVDVGFETARHYGRLKNLLKSKGRPIPENDIWIAASAMQHGLTLVSRDGHFEYCDGLQVEAW